MRLALIVIGLVVAATAAAANPSVELDQARDAFRKGDYVRAQQAYNDLVNPPPPKLGNREEIVEVYVSLGVCRVINGERDLAKEDFKQALAIDPDRQLDPTIVTNKDAIRAFDDTKAEIKFAAQLDAQRKALAEAKANEKELLKRTVVVEEHARIYNLVPFGFGQIQNHQRLKGVLFAGGEALTGFTSLGIWYYLTNKYGLNNQHLNVMPDEAANIRLLQQVEIGTGLAFIGLYLWGVIDANLHYQPQSYRAPDPELLKELKAKQKTSFHVVPVLTPNGGGIGLSWER